MASSRYFYATAYRDAYKKYDSIPNTTEGKKVKSFLRDIMRMNNRENEYNLIMFHRGSENSPNMVNRQLDKKYFDIDPYAELNPEYYGRVIKSGDSGLTTEEEGKFRDNKDSLEYQVENGDQRVIGDATYASEEEQKQILQKHHNNFQDKNSDAYMTQEEKMAKEEKDRQKEQTKRENMKKFFNGTNKDRAKMIAGGIKGKALDIANKNKITKFLIRHGMLLLKTFGIISAIFTLISGIIYLSGLIGNVGEIPYALCTNNKEHDKWALYYVSLPSEAKNSFWGSIENWAIDANFDNFLTEEESGISNKGSIKKDGDKKYGIPTKFREAKNADYKYNIDDLANKNIENNGFSSNNGTFDFGGQSMSGLEFAEAFAKNPLMYSQKGRFNSFEGSGFTVRMRWEYMNYHVDADGKISNKQPQNSDEIKKYKEWLKKQKLVIFNPMNKRYVVVTPDFVEGEGGTKDLNWGPDDINYIGSVSTAVEKYLGFGGENGYNTTIAEAGRDMGYYWVPEDVNIGLVYSGGTNVIACKARGNGLGQGNEGIAQAAVSMASPNIGNNQTGYCNGKGSTSLYVDIFHQIYPQYKNATDLVGGRGWSCDVGTSVSVRWAGADDNFPIFLGGNAPAWAGAQWGYLHLAVQGKGPGAGKWEYVGHLPANSTEAQYKDMMQPGDIMINEGHIMIYVGNDAIKQKWPNASSDKVQVHSSHNERGLDAQGWWTGAGYYDQGFEVYRNIVPEANSKYKDLTGDITCDGTQYTPLTRGGLF